MPAWILSSFIFVVLVARWVSVQMREITSPPAVRNTFGRTVYFVKGEHKVLKCPASGYPPPRISWYKDGLRLDLQSTEHKGRLIQNRYGKLMFQPATPDDEGIYQCQATNKYGISLSAKILFRWAEMELFAVMRQKTVKPRIGHALKLNCTAPYSSPRAKIVWGVEADDHPEGMVILDMTERLTMDYEGNLYFLTLEPEDESHVYICMALNSVSRSSISGPIYRIKLTGVVPERMPVQLMWQSPSDVVGILHETITLKCIFSGNPVPSVKWTGIDGKEIKTSARIKMREGNHELVISNLRETDAGTYTCSGHNGVYNKQVTTSITVKVAAKPSWVKKPRDQIVSVDDDAVFDCRAKGIPTPTVQWFINTVPLKDPPSKDRIKVQDGQLHFKKVDMVDISVIQCNTSNKYGYLWGDVYLLVEASPAQIETISKSPVKSVRGATVTLSCTFSGQPKPDVVWVKAGQVLTGSWRYNISEGNLVIEDVGKIDTELYSCEVTNKFGKDRKSVQLIVRDETQILEAPIDRMVGIGEETMFACRAFTDIHEQDSLKYTWLKNNMTFDFEDWRMTQSELDGNFVIHEVMPSDKGFYTCVASSRIDQTTATALLQVKGPPDPPYDITLISCSTGYTARIGWKFDKTLENSSPTTKFIVEYWTPYNNDNWIPAVEVGSKARKASVKLSPYANYTFRVRAASDLGEGEPSVATQYSCMTAPDRPYSNPENVQVITDKTNYIVIEWKPLQRINLNGPAFKYLITLEEEWSGQQTLYNIEDHTVNHREIMVNNIYKPYKIKVEAQNAYGKAMKAAQYIRGYSGEAAPLVTPQNFELDPSVPITASSAGFQWDAVDSSQEVFRGKFQGYKIYLWKRKNPQKKSEIFIPRSKPSSGKEKAIPRNLPPFANLSAVVVAVNTHYASNMSSFINFTTPEGVPGFVRYFVARYHGARHFLLEWGEPKEKNGILIGYKIGYQQVDGLMLDDMKIPLEINDPKEYQSFLGGLEPDSLYRVSIWALTSAGKGDSYYIDVRTTREDIPLAKPEILRIIPSKQLVSVVWELQEENITRAGAIFHVEYRKLGDTPWQRADRMKSSHFIQEITGLQPATTYEARIVSQDSNSFNVYGAAVIFTTEFEIDVYEGGGSGNSTFDDEDDISETQAIVESTGAVYTSKTIHNQTVAITENPKRHNVTSAELTTTDAPLTEMATVVYNGSTTYVALSSTTDVKQAPTTDVKQTSMTDVKQAPTTDVKQASTTDVKQTPTTGTPQLLSTSRWTEPPEVDIDGIDTIFVVTEKVPEGQIHKKPQISSQHEILDISVYSGEVLDLICQVKGYPTPSVVWMKNNFGRISPNNNTVIITYNKIPSSRLILLHTEKLDVGNYKCIAENSLGKAERSFTISLKKRPCATAIGNGSSHKIKISIFVISFVFLYFIQI